MAAKRSREEIISDFSIKPGDPQAIVNALQFAYPEFQTFIEALSDPQLKEFHAYLIKQKNSDRVLDWILSNIQAFKDIQVIHPNEQHQ